MSTVFVLFSSSPDPEVGGGEMSRTTSANVARKWQADGGAVHEEETCSCAVSTSAQKG